MNDKNWMNKWKVFDWVNIQLSNAFTILWQNDGQTDFQKKIDKLKGREIYTYLYNKNKNYI